jgi:hypothetical protein
LDPPTPTTLDAGQSTSVSATVDNAGPGPISSVQASLSAPAGWTVTPSGTTPVGSVPAGGSATVHWQVTAPSGASGQQFTAALTATASYVSDANGSADTVVTSQGPPALLPPHIDSVQPTSAAAGDVVTLSGENFGATQGSSYLLFVDGGTSWGAPYDGAEFHVDSWSDTKITFTIPTPSGPGGIWHVSPGDTTTVNVNTAAGTSNTEQIAITG